jgi:predicted dithiol-disulfide oxidoreductase (DUF899 family)
MGQFHEHRFPGESDGYREARDKLLAAETDLRRRIEAVAELRRSLPPGGVAEDYVFEEGAADLSDRETVTRTKLSELAFLDGLNGSARHIGARANLAVVAKAPIGTIRDWARQRDWSNLRLLSSGGNSYNRDYLAETPDGAQWPLMNVFRKADGAIRHTYGTELFYAAPEPGQHPRHVDLLWPLWNVFDLTPDGRGTDWFPQVSYD